MKYEKKGKATVDGRRQKKIGKKEKSQTAILQNTNIVVETA